MKVSKQELQDFVEDIDENHQLNLIKSKKKAKPNKKFVMLFDENFSEILNSGLSMIDIKVLFSLIKFVSWGNWINLTQQIIAEDINLDQSQVSKAYKKLEGKKIIIRHKNGLLLNPNYIVRGDFAKAKDSEAYKVQRNLLYKEFGEFITDQKLLEDKVNSLMAF